jgi:hypothetical protein
MLSNKENRYRMRCKLIENPYCDSHFEASRLRDYSGRYFTNNKSKNSFKLKNLKDKKCIDTILHQILIQ